MATHFGLVRMLACVCVVAAFAASAARAAPQSVYIDLTGGDAKPVPVSATTPRVTRTIDFTAGTPAASAPAPSAIVSQRYIDLSTGAPPVDVPTQASTTPGPDPGDPYEESNRGRFDAHVALHHNVIDPVEYVYMGTVPEPARFVLHNFLTNLETPTVVFNDVFQGAPGSATTAIGRFVINSTIGIGGLLDVASHIGVRYHDNDFGRTMASYGVSDGPYLLIPVIGPSNPRDLGGKVVDFALDPLHFVTLPGGIFTSIGHAGAHQLDKRQEETGRLDELARTAADPYASERQAARSRRAFETGEDILSHR